MKELVNIAPDKVLEIVKQVESQKKLIKNFSPQPGVKVWEFNLFTGVISVAKTSTAVIEMKFNNLTGKNEPVVKKTIIRNQGCLYEEAINIANAEKKFFKALLKR